ncbi:MAG: DUF3108 domain-containing protein [Burkholderiales bacterium]|nr:DUF3108 domain-containing protein [Burkholderiales bacterium]
MHTETELPLFFVKINLANIDSRGNFDEAGVAPVIYQEKIRNRSLTNTHFNHFRPNAPIHPTNDNTISFSSNSKTFRRVNGAQDRISILWQLAGIARAAPASIMPGTDFTITVAGSRDVDVWHIKVLGMEELRVNGKHYQAWHLQRLARPGSYESTLDIWLAPAIEWMPVRILSTENNGETRDLSLTKINIKPAPPPPAVVATPVSTPAPTFNMSQPNPP